MQIIFEKIHEDAVLPTKGSKHASCFDVYSTHDAIVKYGEVTVIKLGFKAKIPDGYMIHVVPRSGLAAKYGIVVMAGIIDSDYRGEFKVVLTRTIGDPDGYNNIYHIKKGNRIAQMLIHKVRDVDFVEGNIDDTERGSAGFGSTGE
jgi:dUTP pyrophosphatase